MPLPEAAEAKGARQLPVLGYVLKGWPRISETFIAGEIAQLEAEGLRIHILSMRHPRESFSHARYQGIRARADYLPTTLQGGLHRLLPALALCLWRAPRRTCAGLGLLVRRMRVSSRPLATLRHFLQGAYICARLLPGSGIGHLHAHFAHSPTSVALFAAALSGLPFSFTGHAKDVWTQNPRELGRKIGQAAFVVTCTGTNKVYLESLNQAGTRIHAVRHGIDLQHFAFRPRTEAPQPPYQLLTVARLTAKKGLPTVLQALAELRRQCDARLTLVGAGDDEAELRRLVVDLGLRDVVDFAGVQPHERVRQELARAHVFVLGSRITKNGDRDGIPNVLAEAMASGLPVVATAVSAIPELVEHGVSGLLVPPQDPQAMAQAVLRALTDLPWRQASTVAARARVEAIFDQQANTRQLADIFCRELGR